MIRSFGNTRLMTQTGSSIALAGPPVVGLRGIAPGRECCGWKTRRRADGACNDRSLQRSGFLLPPLQGEGWGGDGFARGARGAVTETHPHPCLPLEGEGIPSGRDTAATTITHPILAFPLKGKDSCAGATRLPLSVLARPIRRCRCRWCRCGRRLRRSDERRVGKECGRTGRSRWVTDD